MSKIFYLMGKSSAGKDSIYKLLSQKMPFFKRLVTYTTRPMRHGETEGVEYHFITDAALSDLKNQGKIIEVREYHTAHGLWSYCTVNDEQFYSDDVFLAIGTLESYVSLKNYFKEGSIYPIYIEVDDTTRLERAIAREKKQDVAKYEEMCRRFLADAADFSEEKLRDAGISYENRFLNEDMQECAIDVMAYIIDVLMKSIKTSEDYGKVPYAKDIYSFKTGNKIIYSCPVCKGSLGIFMQPPKFCSFCETKINWENVQLDIDISSESDLETIQKVLKEINEKQQTNRR